MTATHGRTSDGTRRGRARGGIIPEGEPPPEGTRVRYHPVVIEDENEDDDFDPPPPSTETREEFLASLRESVAEARAGVLG